MVGDLLLLFLYKVKKFEPRSHFLSRLIMIAKRDKRYE